MIRFLPILVSSQLEIKRFILAVIKMLMIKSLVIMKRERLIVLDLIRLLG